MVNSISRSSFVRFFNDESLKVQQAQKDQRLQDVNVAEADLNHDGKISGEAEAEALFRQLDRSDRDGNSRSIRLVDAQGRPTTAARQMQAVGELANVKALRDMAQAAPQTSGTKRNDDVLMVGLNTETANHEVTDLRRRGVRVLQVKDAPVNDTIQVARTTYDLSTEAGIKGFVGTLGLPESQANKIADVIRDTSTDGRDEIAQVAQVWAKGEKGDRIPSRLMISAHSAGASYWGDGNGTITRDVFVKLAEAMPKAARQVEDIHLSACYSAGEAAFTDYQRAFPNVNTIWAYSGSAPGANSGATTHIRLWEAATRGDKDGLRPELAAGTRKGEYVAVWSKAFGAVSRSEDIGDILGRVDRGQSTFQSYLNGNQTASDPQTGPLRDYYNDVQSAVQHPRLPANRRDALAHRVEQTIRLLYFTKSIAPKFQEHHASRIAAGFTALGMTPPDFSKLSRADALAKISAFEAAVSQLGAKAPAEARQLLSLLTKGLRDLNPSIIPSNWI